MKTSAVFVGTQEACKAFLGERRAAHYVYILRRPDGRPFYVGKGVGARVHSHENEARHPNDRRSNNYKLNVIRSIWRSGAIVSYEIDCVTEDATFAYAREAELISLFKRLHEGGPLTNLAPGGGTADGISPASRKRHSTTLGGIPKDNPERAALNRFVLSIAQMKSVILKPIHQFVPRPTQPWPTRTIKPSLRTAVALVASAASNNVSMDGSCQIPRRVTVEGIDGLVENGVACAVLMSGMGLVVPDENPANESFVLSAEQSRKAAGMVGFQKCFDLGVLTSVPA